MARARLEYMKAQDWVFDTPGLRVVSAGGKTLAKIMADELDADEEIAISLFAYAVEEAPRKASYHKRWPNNPERIRLELKRDLNPTSTVIDVKD